MLANTLTQSPECKPLSTGTSAFTPCRPPRWRSPYWPHPHAHSPGQEVLPRRAGGQFSDGGPPSPEGPPTPLGLQEALTHSLRPAPGPGRPALYLQLTPPPPRPCPCCSLSQLQPHPLLPSLRAPSPQGHPSRLPLLSPFFSPSQPPFCSISWARFPPRPAWEGPATPAAIPAPLRSPSVSVKHFEVPRPAPGPHASARVPVSLPNTHIQVRPLRPLRTPSSAQSPRVPGAAALSGICFLPSGPRFSVTHHQPPNGPSVSLKEALTLRGSASSQEGALALQDLAGSLQPGKGVVTRPGVEP